MATKPLSEKGTGPLKLVHQIRTYVQKIEVLSPFLCLSWLLAGSLSYAQAPGAVDDAQSETPKATSKSEPKKKISYHKEPQSPVMEVRPVDFQIGPGAREYKEGTDTYAKRRIRFDPPDPSVVFKLESEAHLNDRIRQEYREREPMERAVFPEEPRVSNVSYSDSFKFRSFQQHTRLVEPHVVFHDHLLFEEKNCERYGWDLGIASPVVSTLYFYKDVLTMPYHLAMEIGKGPTCSAGKCLPGDQVPFLVYPAEVSLMGGIGEGLAIVGVLAAFP
jgi:hypothetical protein